MAVHDYYVCEVNLIFTIVASIFVLLRCVSRFAILRHIGVDDVLCVLALPGSIALTVTVYKQRYYGLGQDIWTLPPQDLAPLFKFFWASILAYAVGLTLCKVSMLCQLLQFLLFGWLRRVCQVMLILCASFGIGSVFFTIFACQPISFAWNKTLPHGRCVDESPFWTTSSVWTAATDVIIVMLPILGFRNLNMPKRQKIILITVFALGGIATITAWIRVPFVVKLLRSTNYTKDNALPATFSSLELNIGIICACIPTLKPLVQKFSSSLLGNNGQTSLDARKESGPDTSAALLEKQRGSKSSNPTSTVTSLA